MPPTILPTVILVWAMAAPQPSDSAMATAKPAVRRFLMAYSSQTPPVPAGSFR
jgi:hypothetical protein